MTFTAAQVREIASSPDCNLTCTPGDCRFCDASRMLTAYADRLEQDERPHANLQFIGTGQPSHWFTPAELRQEGRNEILREIAALGSPNGIHETSACWFCQCYVNDHDANCLWLKAQQATHEPVTP